VLKNILKTALYTVGVNVSLTHGLSYTCGAFTNMVTL